MKLSEAILLGAMRGKQMFGRAFGPDDSSCALGSALLAVGRHLPLARLSEWVKLFPEVKALPLCPMCGDNEPGHPNDGVGTVAHLNDRHRWTRERIAGWVSTFELREAGVTPTSEEVMSR